MGNPLVGHVVSNCASQQQKNGVSLTALRFLQLNFLSKVQNLSVLSIFLIFTVRFVGKRALDSILFQSRVQIIFAEGWSVGKMESLHQFRSGECFAAECGEKTLKRRFILVAILVAVLVAVATDNGYFAQGIPNNFQHQFYESCTIGLCVCRTKRIVVFLLSSLDQFFNGQPEK